ncbi:MAG TPA: c-type cytochrome, partial [Rubrivivax sp.]|nr:c-type cytochrome [Rubrivivax sp.]
MSKAITLLLALAGAFLATAGAHAQDAAAGEKKAAMCIGCHGIKGYQSSFPQVHKVPMISGQGAKYIVAALTAYKKGERSHPSMRGIAGSLTDEDMADLGAYYEQHGASMVKTVAETPAAQPPAEVAELLTRGACASCHGANYSTPIDGSYAKLAGQHADYLFVALNAYAVGAQPQIGRNNAIM